MMFVSRKGTIFILVLLLLDRSIAINFFNKSEPKADPYKVLGVKRTATDEDVQKAYRKKAKETHREPSNV